MKSNTKSKRVMGYAFCIASIVAISLFSFSLSVPAQEVKGSEGHENRGEGRGEHGEKRGESRGEHGGKGGEGGAEHGGEGGEGRGEHGGKGSEGRGESEETGTELKLTDIYTKTKNGAQVTLKYDKRSHSFVGTVKNVTQKSLERVRVEIHLSNGIELGPTKPVNLAAGKSMPVKLAAKGKAFVGWSAHAELGSGEHQGEKRGTEGRGEHGGKGREGEKRGEHR
ncbi:hypothetical protein N8612_00505 [Verrucomicrobia bacterium]|jgi:hypothetical protein|nr:hypothetical protein [Verrucomicrobiota bacterium]